MGEGTVQNTTAPLQVFKTPEGKARFMQAYQAALVPRANHIAAMSNPDEINKRTLEAFGV